MIEVTIYTSSGRQTVLADPNSTVKNTLDSRNVNYGTATLQLDGSAVVPGTLDKTFTELGIKDKCAVSAIIKTSNAGR